MTHRHIILLHIYKCLWVPPCTKVQCFKQWCVQNVTFNFCTVHGAHLITDSYLIIFVTYVLNFVSIQLTLILNWVKHTDYILQCNWSWFAVTADDFPIYCKCFKVTPCLYFPVLQYFTLNHTMIYNQCTFLFLLY